MSIIKPGFFTKAWNRKGSILAITAMVSVVAIVLGAGFLYMLVAESHHTRRFINITAARYMAEAGLERGFWEIKYSNADFTGAEGWVDTAGTFPYKKTMNIQSDASSLGGDVAITVDKIGTKKYSIEAAAYLPDNINPVVEKVVHVRTDYKPFPPYSVFGNDGLDLEANILVDSYNSSLGNYDPKAPHGMEGDIGTNSISETPPAISLEPNSTIFGDVNIGPGGDITKVIDNAGTVIQGTEEVLTQPVVLPSIVPPSGLPLMGDVVYSGKALNVVNTDGQYDSLIIDINSDLIFDQDINIYVTGLFQISSNSDLIIENNAVVNIYVDGQIVFESNTHVNNKSNDPQKLLIAGTDKLIDPISGTPGVDINSYGRIYGVIYCPQSTVDIDSNVDIFGAVVGKNIVVASNVEIHFDENLNDHPPDAFGHSIKSGTWIEKK